MQPLPNILQAKGKKFAVGHSSKDLNLEIVEICFITYTSLYSYNLSKTIFKANGSKVRISGRDTQAIESQLTQTKDSSQSIIRN